MSRGVDSLASGSFVEQELVIVTEKKSYLPGITLRSVFASLFSMVVMGAMIFIGQVMEGSCVSFGEHALPVPALIVFVGLSLVCGGIFALTRFRVLTRAELLCIMFAMFMALPIMTQGFWRRAVSVTATLTRTTGDFERIDSLSDRLWPHGPNLLIGGLDKENAEQLEIDGAVIWQEVEYEKDRKTVLPVITNTASDQTSTIRLRVPVKRDGETWVRLGQPYMLSILARAQNLGADATYFCRVYNDDAAERVSEAFTSKAPANVNYLHKTGFVRVGNFAATFSREAKEYVVLEFGLKGEGTLELCDPKLMNVEALEYAYSATNLVTQSNYNSLPESERGGKVVKPDNMWSLAGLKFVLTGYIPLRDWAETLFSWFSFMALLLITTFAIAVIMRKQWIDSERYPLPLARIPLYLLGEEEQGNYALPPIWRNRMMWIGFAFSLFWCLARAWRLYNPNVPDMNVEFPLRPYFQDAGWGLMWDGVTFKISAVFVALAIFMELNVLISLVIGYFVFRAGFWFGKSAGLDIYPGFPFRDHQFIGSFLAYAFVILFFTRKHLWRVLKAAITGDKLASEGELFSYRTAVLLLVGCVAGAFGWTKWIGVPASGVMLFFGFLVLIGFVGAKLRAECGAPMSHYFPTQAMLFATLTGGMALYGANGFTVCVIASFMFAPTVFFMISGMQVEVIEIGRRFRVQPRHIVYSCIIGLFGGAFIGGWVFLSSSYGLGGDNVFEIWSFADKSYYFIPYNVEMNKATQRMVGDAAAMAPMTSDPSFWSIIYAGGVTVVLAVFRQLFAGFWFHPIGFITGPTWMMLQAWGSVLVAWAIRLIVLKLGGAATVRNKLLPFFVGVFLAAILAYLLLGSFSAYLFFFQPGEERFGLLF